MFPGISELTLLRMESTFTEYDVKRLELYSKNMVDYHLIMDMLPDLAKLFFLQQLGVQLSAAQSVSQMSLSKTIESAWYLQFYVWF